jgi:chromosome segregation ATPase
MAANAPLVDESEGSKAKQKELLLRIREREERVKRQQERLEQLNAQLGQLEGPQRHTIEQIRIELDRVTRAESAARAESNVASAELAECTELLERKTEGYGSSRASAEA